MAIITDKLRIVNCSNFINSVSDGSYYTFIGFPNSNSFYPNWDSDQPNPTDNELYLNSYRDNILGVKKITSSDVIRVIPKNVWTRGKKYEMYRHDYSVRNVSPVTSSTRLYDSAYYVMNSEYRVYICINNNSLPSNTNKGTPSTQEPLHTDLAPREETDGYIWKYLYTLSPADVLKFDSTNYMSVPNDWETTSNFDISRIRDSAVDGQIETVIIENNSNTYPFVGTLTNVPIKGDGSGAEASIEFDETGTPTKVTVTSGGNGYTFATLDLDSVLLPSSGLLSSKTIFNVIIPPSGGHGKNIYTELGAFRALVYSRIENNPTNPDFIVGNQFSRIGIIKNLKSFGSDALFTDSTGSGVYAFKLNESAVSNTYDSIITQENSNSIGNLVSFDADTKVLRYIKPRTNNIDTYAITDASVTNIQIDYHFANSVSNLQTPSNYDLNDFDQSQIKIGSSTYTINTSFNDNKVDVGGTRYYLGQNFSGGLSNPDINIQSGDILYVDNRSSVTRSSQQREDIKIILEF